MEADDQAIQTILLGLPEDIYAAVDSCETAQEIWLRVQQMMKGSDIGISRKKKANTDVGNRLLQDAVLKSAVFQNVARVRVRPGGIGMLLYLAELSSDLVILRKADESIAKQKALELEIERLLSAVNDLKTVSLNKEEWNMLNFGMIGTKKCEECKYDKISYDKAYNDMQQKIERLQAQLGEPKGSRNMLRPEGHSLGAYKNDRVPLRLRVVATKNKEVEVERTP
ncbi:hypothetical protein Tco_1103358 [Tanacetum coccineum]